VARDVYDELGVPRVVNCVGYATRVGGSCPAPHVLEAMRAASQSYIEIDDLQTAASALIAKRTGADAGIVTCGAAAALTLAAAACLARNDPEHMDRLPDVSGLPRCEIIYPALGPYDYEHPVRASGAKLITLNYESPNVLDEIDRAITDRTAAVGCCWLHVDERPPVRELAKLAHRHGLPLIVDAALSLPPTDNLRHFIAGGADLVTYSGGKHLGGPQASGILCGRCDLVRSAWAQMVDMDVRPGTWSLRSWIDEGWIARPPRHGIGRPMKVGKEAIVGLMTALEDYAHRDHAAELARWTAARDEIAAGLRAISGVCVEPMFLSPTGQPYPIVRIDVPRLDRLIAHLRTLRPKVILAEAERDPRRAYVYPMCLRDGEPRYVVESIRNALTVLT